MSIVSIVEKAFAGLIALLQAEATRHGKKQEHHERKAYNHRAAEEKAIRNMKEAGAVYRTSLYATADEHAIAADKASQLAIKIAKVIE
jgi:hypothetical protein